jgi:hypothetical protein
VITTCVECETRPVSAAKQKKQVFTCDHCLDADKERERNEKAFEEVLFADSEPVGEDEEED